MHSVLCLQVHLRVPVRVKNDDGVCSLKVQAQSSSSCAEQEHIELAVGFVEKLHSFLAVFGLGGPIEPQVANSSELEIRLHDVHEMSHLGEDEHAMSESFEFGQDAIDELKFAGRADDPLVVADVIVIFEEEVRVVAAFPQLHHQVGQSGLADLARVVGELQGCLAGNVLVDQFLPS